METCPYGREGGIKMKVFHFSLFNFHFIFVPLHLEGVCSYFYKEKQ